MDLNGKKIVLTGGSSGIGKALLFALMAYDVQVVVADLEPDKVETYGGKVFPVECDVSRPENIDTLFDQSLEKIGRIDIFIANAGFAYMEEIQHADWDHMDRIFRTNLMSPIYAMEKMMEINAGREYLFVVTASLMARLPIPGYSLYSATKAGLDAFFYAQRFEKSDLGRTMVVFPVSTKTAFFDTAGGSNAPVVWPALEPEKVALAIMDGIRKDRRNVFPSKLSWIIRMANATHVLFHPVVRLEQRKFKRWWKKRTSE